VIKTNRVHLVFLRIAPELVGSAVASRNPEYIPPLPVLIVNKYAFVPQLPEIPSRIFVVNQLYAIVIAEVFEPKQI